MPAYYDCHIHSHISEDSKASLAQMCQGAIAHGLTGVAFAEHYDLNPNDSGYRFFNHARYFQEFSAVRTQFGDRLKLLKGVEFGEPHLYPEAFTEVQQQDYDVIIGSIHWAGPVFVGAKEVLLTSTPRVFYESYYQIMLDMVQFGGFDILAHIDFPKRYLKTNITDLPILEDVLASLIATDIALEINTSSLRKGLPEVMPAAAILRRYAELGGRRITFGSDAHVPEDVGAGFDYARELVTQFPQFEVGYFEQRRFVPISGTTGAF